MKAHGNQRPQNNCTSTERSRNNQMYQNVSKCIDISIFVERNETLLQMAPSWKFLRCHGLRHGVLRDNRKRLRRLRRSPLCLVCTEKTLTGQLGLAHGMRIGGKLVGNRSVTGRETDGKRVGHGSETGFLQGFSRVSLVFLEVFFTVSLGFLQAFFRISFWVSFGILEGLFRVSLGLL